MKILAIMQTGLCMCVTYDLHKKQDHVEKGAGNWHVELVGDCLQLRRLWWKSEEAALVCKGE
jgi:hypothetical protein